MTLEICTMQGNKTFEKTVTLCSYLCHIGVTTCTFITKGKEFIFILSHTIFLFEKKHKIDNNNSVFFYVQEDFSNTWTFHKITSSFFIISKKFVTPDGEMSFLIKFSACSLDSLQNFINSIKVWNVGKCIQPIEMPRKKERKLEKIVKMASALKW